MTGHNTAVFGIYRDRNCMDRAIDVLRRAGFRHTDLSVLIPENEGTKDLAFKKGTKAPEGTAAGATAGAVLGGMLAWLVSSGVVTIPGLETLIVIGQVLAVLAGVGAGGVAGGLAGALIGFTAPKYEAKRYEGQIRRGAILMSVHCDQSDWVKRAKGILSQTGAEDIAAAAEASADFLRSDKPLPRQAGPWVEDRGAGARYDLSASDWSYPERSVRETESGSSVDGRGNAG